MRDGTSGTSQSVKRGYKVSDGRPGTMMTGTGLVEELRSKRQGTGALRLRSRHAVAGKINANQAYSSTP